MYRAIAVVAATVFVLYLTASNTWAVEDSSDPITKSFSQKSCPKGTRYSSGKRGCVKTSCETGKAWNSATDSCIDGRSAALSDDDLYLAGRDLGQEGRYAEA